MSLPNYPAFIIVQATRILHLNNNQYIDLILHQYIIFGIDFVIHDIFLTLLYITF